MTSVHEGTKAFKCDICDYMYSIKNNLNKHVTNLHEGKKPLNWKGKHLKSNNENWKT